MAKFVRLSFTGVCVVSPSYSGNNGNANSGGPVRALMPSSPRARLASDNQTQINAQIAFIEYPLEHFEESTISRAPDFKYDDPNDQNKTKKRRRGMTILSGERLTPEIKPSNNGVTYDESGAAPAPGVVPTKASTHAGWIANWDQFAADGGATLKPLSPATQSYVEVELPGGHISSTFRCEQPKLSEAEFVYGDAPEKRYYAHEAVVTLSYPDDTPTFTLRSTSLQGGPSRDLVFKWGDRDVFEILIGNGALMSLEHVRKQDFCGHDHESLTDFEFEVLYDVVDCRQDRIGRKPVPRVFGREIRQIPCIVSTIGGTRANGEVVEFPRSAVPRPVSAYQASPEDPLGDEIPELKVPNILRSAEALNHVCRFVLNGETFATGFLVGPDLVITAAHTFFKVDGTLIDPGRAAAMSVEFDQVEISDTQISFKQGDGNKAVCRLASGASWMFDPTLDNNGVARREVDKLDYAIVRLDKPIGSETIGQAADKRGWFRFPDSENFPLLSENEFVRILQHGGGNDGELRFAVGLIRTISRERKRIGYTASTFDGASGSMVANDSYDPVALHVAGSDEHFRLQNQGLPLRWIWRDLHTRGVLALMLPGQTAVSDGEDASAVVPAEPETVAKAANAKKKSA